MAASHSRNASESRRSLLGGEGEEGVLGTALTVLLSLIYGTLYIPTDPSIDTSD
jgi:hypothetical protein